MSKQAIVVDPAELASIPLRPRLSRSSNPPCRGEGSKAG